MRMTVLVRHQWRCLKLLNTALEVSEIGTGVTVRVVDRFHGGQMRISIMVSESSSGLSNCALKFWEWDIFETRILIENKVSQPFATASVCDKLSVTAAYIFVHTGSLLYH